MDIPFIPKESRWHSLARHLHVGQHESRSKKVVNTLLHILLYISLMLFGYFLGLLQFAT